METKDPWTASHAHLSAPIGPIDTHWRETARLTHMYEDEPVYQRHSYPVYHVDEYESDYPSSYDAYHEEMIKHYGESTPIHQTEIPVFPVYHHKTVHEDVPVIPVRHSHAEADSHAETDSQDGSDDVSEKSTA